MRKAFISNQKSILSGGMFERWYSEDDTPFAIGLEENHAAAGSYNTVIRRRTGKKG